MPRMRAVDAAVAILEKEGATQTFGLPGAAINPFYDAMRKHGGIRHVLARHVEGASHMADGYTRAAHGNIGVCIGTSGPAGTDMITGLYAAWADSVPILCITGQAPVAKLDKEDFQAVDIASIAAPVTKMAKTVLEAGQVPGVFQQAFQLMRSGRPGPVLIDLPLDVQLTEIDFDPDTYEPLPVLRPEASRAQVEKALDMLLAAEHPLIVAGGGIVNAGAEAELVELAETLGVPVISTLMGWGAIADDHPLSAGMVGIQTSQRYGNATFLESDFVLGWATGGPTGTRAAWTPTGAGAPSSTSTSSPPRSGASSPPSTASSPTPALSCGPRSRLPGSAGPRARCRTTPRGSPAPRSASARCTARRTSPRRRSSRSASTRR